MTLAGGLIAAKLRITNVSPPTGFVKVTAPKDNSAIKGLESPRLPSPLPPHPPSPPPPPPPAQREITIDDVRGFLVKEKAAKTEHRRNTWISSLF